MVYIKMSHEFRSPRMTNNLNNCNYCSDVRVVRDIQEDDVNELYNKVHHLTRKLIETGSQLKRLFFLSPLPENREDANPRVHYFLIFFLGRAG
jgi:hypothetical protein